MSSAQLVLQEEDLLNNVGMVAYTSAEIRIRGSASGTTHFICFEYQGSESAAMGIRSG